MKCRILQPMRRHDGVEIVGDVRGRKIERHKTTMLPAGSEIDHPEAFLLVQQGAAEAADEGMRQCLRHQPRGLRQGSHRLSGMRSGHRARGSGRLPRRGNDRLRRRRQLDPRAERGRLVGDPSAGMIRRHGDAWTRRQINPRVSPSPRPRVLLSHQGVLI